MDQEFVADLRGIVARVDAPYRAPVERNLDLLLRAGATSFDRLLETLRDGHADIELRAVACWFLARVHDRRAGPALLAAFRDATLPQSLRGEAARGLASRRYKRAARALIGALREPEAALRVEAARALGDLGDERAVIPMAEAVRDDPDPDVRMWAVHALGRLGGQVAVDVARATLLDRSQPEAVRGMAAEALVYARASKATPDLIAALREPEPAVRFWAAYALGELAGVEAVPALEVLLGDDSLVPGWWSVEKEARDAIEQIRARGGGGA